MSVFTIQYLAECKVDRLTAWSQVTSKSGHLIFAMKKKHIGDEITAYFDFAKIIQHLIENDILFSIRRCVSSDNRQPGQSVDSTFCTVEDVINYYEKAIIQTGLGGKSD